MTKPTQEQVDTLAIALATTQQPPDEDWQNYRGRALAILTLPPLDPNIIYPGKDDTNVFPEE